MRDDSPYREPSIDADRKPELIIYDDDKCAACGTKDRLETVHNDWILCAEHAREHREWQEES
jgi:hypothetical protein